MIVKKHRKCNRFHTPGGGGSSTPQPSNLTEFYLLRKQKGLYTNWISESNCQAINNNEGPIHNRTNITSGGISVFQINARASQFGIWGIDFVRRQPGSHTRSRTKKVEIVLWSLTIHYNSLHTVKRDIPA